MDRLLVACLALLVTAVAAGSGAVAPATAGSPSGPVLQFQDGASANESTGGYSDGSHFDRVEFHITVDRDGSARWTFRYLRTLRDEDEREAFETFADRFESEETGLYENFRRQADGLTAASTEQTGRQMDATGFERTAYVRTGLNDFGVVEMSFRWHGFAEVDDGRVYVGDVFAGGLYIGPDQRLVVVPGDGLRFAEATPSPDSTTADRLAESNSITWTGEQQFTDRHPRIVFAPTDDAGAPGGIDAESEGTSPDSIAERSVVAFVGLLIVLVGIGMIVRRRSSHDGPEFDRVDVDPDRTRAPTSATNDHGEESSIRGGVQPAVPDEELLSDEDRVFELLEENGGRMKQVNIVDETGWSKSKVSMLLSDMEEEGTISKLRVGRENIISLAGREPGAARSTIETGAQQSDPDA